MRLFFYLLILCGALIFPSYWTALASFKFLLMMNLLVLLFSAVIFYLKYLNKRLILKNKHTLRYTRLLNFSAHLCCLSLFILVALSWSHYRAQLYLDKQLSNDWTAQNLIVEGRVASLVEMNSNPKLSSQSFMLDVANVQGMDGETLDFPPTKIRVSWYSAQDKVRVAQRWRFTLKVKNPRSYLSKGTFDYRLWLFKQGVTAQASVKRGQLISAKEHNTKNGFFSSYAVHQLRQLIRAKVLTLNSKMSESKQGSSPVIDSQLNSTEQNFNRYPNNFSDNNATQENSEINIDQHTSQFDLLLALLIGDKSFISAQGWKDLQQTGTSHLVAISGLHIGMIAAFFYFLVLFILRFISWPLKFYPNIFYAALGSLVVAAGYAMLAGFSLPTQRALVMLFCLLLSQLFKIPISLLTRLLIALVVVFIIDPWATHNASVFLSFLTVLVLFVGLTGFIKKSSTLKLGVMSQFYLLWIIYPLTLYYFYQVPVSAMLINLIAIPYFSLFILPLCFVFLISLSFNPMLIKFFDIDLSYQIFLVLNSALGYFSTTINSLSSWQLPIYLVPSLDVIQLITFIVLALLIVLFRFKILMLIYALCLVLLFVPKPNKYPLQVHVLDVGQGLAVLVQTKNKSLIFDVGVAYPSGFNMADSVVLPFLKHQAIRHIDSVVLSHRDQDHAGSIDYLLDNVTVDEILLGDTQTRISNRRNNMPQIKSCVAQRWQWDGVTFEVIYANSEHKKSNDRSCVVLISWADISILLPGDISKGIERGLINTTQKMVNSASAQSLIELNAPLNLLVAAHHGSKTSSSRRFLRFLQPQNTVFSVGYQHYFKHPHAKVVQRYEDINSQMWRTDKHGSMSFYWSPDQKLSIEKGVDEHNHYWNKLQ